MPLSRHTAGALPLLLAGCLTADPVPTAPGEGEGPDGPGGWIYYDQGPDDETTGRLIWRTRWDGTETERVIGPTPYYYAEGFDVQSGGRQLAVRIGSKLYIWPPGQVVPSFKIGDTHRLGPMRWSPDWRHILTTGFSGEPPRSRLHLVPTSGLPERELASHDYGLQVVEWYATGDSAVVLFDQIGTQVVRMDGSRRPLSALFDNREVRSVSPSGDRALLIGPATGPAGRDHRWRIQDPNRGTIIWERTLRGRPREVTWSLDRRYMVFSHESELQELPGAKLIRLDTVTGELAAVVSGGGLVGSPRWVAE